MAHFVHNGHRVEIIDVADCVRHDQYGPITTPGGLLVTEKRARVELLTGERYWTDAKEITVIFDIPAYPQVVAPVQNTLTVSLEVPCIQDSTEV